MSLVLNLSFLGSAAYTRYRQNRSRPTPFGYVIPGRASSSCVVKGRFFEQLSLGPEQLQFFQQKAGSFYEAIDKKREEVKQQRASLFGLMRAEYPDRRAIEATIAQINKTQEEMQKMSVAHMLEFKALLDKDQQKKFFDLIEEAMSQRGE
jgi:Spy/CpxP family protein refolding chaperone